LEISRLAGKNGSLRFLSKRQLAFGLFLGRGKAGSTPKVKEKMPRFRKRGEKTNEKKVSIAINECS